MAETSAHGGQYRYGWDAAGRMAMAAEQGGGHVAPKNISSFYLYLCYNGVIVLFKGLTEFSSS